MKRLFWILALILLSPACGIEPTDDLIPCRTVYVIDGDTLIVKIDHQEERVRLLRINTPEEG